jgi:iron complex transport system ATP-binding protein
MVTLRLEALGARYGDRLALSGITTPDFRGGELVAVVGPNAAGKSTLFRRMAGLVAGPGSVALENARKGQDGICYMPQDSSASARLTVYESILLARKQLDASWSVADDDLAPIDAVMASLGISELAFRYLGELSGGQRQLASIAQTLAREPEVLLMDEPTSALDLHRQLQVLRIMREMARARGLIVLVALHDLNQALRFFDQALVIASGTAYGSGPCKDVITVDMLRQVYRVEARIEPCSLGIGQIIVDGTV